TGKRDIVVVAHGGRFEPVEVEVGRVVGGDVEVRRGLTEGQQVVASGQFLIDSEASLRSALPRLANAAAATGAAGTVHSADGVFEGSDGDEVMLSHGPVPSLKWPPMTMGFRKPADGKLPALQPGDRIRFDFIERAGEWQLTRIERTGAPR
ncbi:MAG TPA: copper-binding protein, partial [Burkholderiaceae bacterium]|nr:copper-binding protein [Burkholderiaceae bacterium]